MEIKQEKIERCAFCEEEPETRTESGASDGMAIHMCPVALYSLMPLVTWNEKQRNYRVHNERLLREGWDGREEMDGKYFSEELPSPPRHPKDPVTYQSRPVTFDFWFKRERKKHR